MSAGTLSARWRRIPGTRYAPQIGLLVALWVYFIASSGTFRGSAAIYPILQSFALLGVVALGIGLTMIVGELDLSVGSMAALSGVIAIYASPLGLLPAILISVAIGAGYGLLQGTLITRLGISSLAVTIASLIGLRGVALLISGEAPINGTDDSIGEPLFARLWIFSTVSALAIILFIVVGLFMAYTKLGHEMYATGGARDEARAAGVRTDRSIVIAFAVSGAFAALAGALVGLGANVATPTNFSTLLFTAPTAVLVGGVALTGGRGTVLNIALGVAIIALISSGTADQGLPNSFSQLVTGGLLVAVVAIEFVSKRLKGARDRLAARSIPNSLSLKGNNATNVG